MGVIESSLFSKAPTIVCGEANGSSWFRGELKSLRKYIVSPMNSTVTFNSHLDYIPVNNTLHNLPVNRIFMKISFLIGKLIIVLYIAITNTSFFLDLFLFILWTILCARNKYWGTTVIVSYFMVECNKYCLVFDPTRHKQWMHRSQCEL